MIQTMNCLDCGQSFQFEPNPAFPRKYCDACSKQRKLNWNAKKTQAVAQTAQSPQIQPQEPVSNVFHHNVSPNSYEFGPAQNRHKVYYGDVNELKAKIDALREAGLITE